MATSTKKRSARGSPQPVEIDGDDLLPVPKAAVPKEAEPKKPKRKKTPKRSLPSEYDEMDDGSGADVDAGPLSLPPGQIEMDGLPQHNRRTMELEAQMQAMATGTPVFPYPPELRDELKPHWVTLVNSFPKDHFYASDVPLMKIYVQCAYDIERQNLLIEEEGEVVLGGRGPMVNPRCKVRDNRVATMMSLATKFRNQPASRVNTENFGNRQQKAASAAAGARATQEDEDDLLARPGEDSSQMRH